MGVTMLKLLWKKLVESLRSKEEDDFFKRIYKPEEIIVGEHGSLRRERKATFEDMSKMRDSLDKADIFYIEKERKKR